MVFFGVLAIIALAMILLVSLRNSPTVPTKVPLSQLEVVSLEKTPNTIELNDLKGRVVLVNLWGVWCPPCLQELPEIVELQADFANQPDFQLLAISCGPSGFQDELEVIRQATNQLLATKNYQLVAFADPNGATRKAIVEHVDKAAFPTTIVLDRQHNIRRIWQGYSPNAVNEMRTTIRQLLNEPK